MSSHGFAAAISELADSAAAVTEVCDAIDFSCGSPDFSCVFCSQHHSLSKVVDHLALRFDCSGLIGCTGESVIGSGKEIEDGPAISLWCGWMPDNELKLMHLKLEQTADGAVISGWPDDLPDRWPVTSSLVMLGEPFSFPADYLLQRLNEDQPGRAVVGGMASGGTQPGENQVALGDRVFEVGAVAAWLNGPIQMRAAVSQGCRPIGHPLVVTHAERNVIHELGGRPALAQLQELFRSLPNREQQLVQRGLHLGRVVNEQQERFEDFLIRNVVAIEEESNGLVVGDFMRVGQTVQFHVRDRETADADLKRVLRAVPVDRSAEAALLFTCNGRGSRFFDQPHHDVQIIKEAVGDIPLSGFFAQGEIGPVGGENFLHGFTASTAFFYAPKP